jgi:hypothetical protein
MEPSEEIRRVIHRWLTSVAAAEADSVLARLSELPGGRPRNWGSKGLDGAHRIYAVDLTGA